MNKHNKLKTAANVIGKSIATVFSAVFSLIALLVKIVFAVVKLPIQLVGKFAEFLDNTIKNSKWSQNHPALSSIIRTPGEAVQMLSELSTKVLNVQDGFINFGLKRFAIFASNGSFDFGKELNKGLNQCCEKIDKLSGTADFYIPAEHHSKNNISQSNDNNNNQTNNKPHYSDYFPKMNFKKGMLDLKESAIEENLIKPL